MTKFGTKSLVIKIQFQLFTQVKTSFKLDSVLFHTSKCASINEKVPGTSKNVYKIAFTHYKDYIFEWPILHKPFTKFVFS
jgi:hypothetical protein